MNDFWGNPLVASGGDGVRKTQVVDAQGRARFHGAFEGGFSAGFFNTVGSATGWQASGARRQQRTIEDYMDEEDDLLMGRGISTTDEFSNNLQLEHVWGKSLIPGPVPNELLNTASSTGLLEKCMRTKQSSFVTKRVVVAVKHVGKQGLGYDLPTTWGEEEESPEVVNWKQSKGCDEGALSFHVVEVEEEKDNKRSSVSANILSQHAPQHQAMWPDGTRLPSGFQVAKRQAFSSHQTNPSPPQSVPSVHVFSAGVTAPRFKRKPRWDVVNEYKRASSPPPEQDARALLAARFSTSSAHRRSSDGSEKATKFDGFTTSEFEWTPSDLLKGLFGINSTPVVTAAAAVEKPRPSLADFNAILVPEQPYEALHSSEEDDDDSQVEEEEERPRKKHKKHKKKHKHHHKKKRKRRSRSSSSSE